MTTRTKLKWAILVVLIGATTMALRLAWHGFESSGSRAAIEPHVSPSSGPPPGPTGEDLFSTFCVACHGSDGRGAGPAAGYCRISPADLTRAEFKVRSTPTGALPTDADLEAVIRHGAGGDGAMPGFDFLKDDDIRRLLARIKLFSPRWEHDQAPSVVVLPARTDGNTARGGRLYGEWGCAACHGPTGEGNGPRAKELRNARGLPEPPTDLTRPWTFKAGSDEIGLVRSVLTGFNGTTMPAFGLQAGRESDIWDLAAYMRSRQTSPEPPETVTVDTSSVAGYWSTPVPRQGGALSAASCAACHASQFSDWSGTRHSLAMGPGVWAQMNDQPELSGMCARCHAPLREQLTDPYTSADGIGCSVCHSRTRQKFGPPPKATSVATLVSAYPAPHGPAVTREFFESVDFCAGCHQFSAGSAPLVHGALLQNTVEEWRSSRAAREGKTCQTCHMPDRRHLFRGIHDPETVRGGVRWTFDARLAGGSIASRMTLTNTETGHAFPTYVVPEVWMRIELVADSGASRVVSERLISRRVAFAQGQWTEVSDTRLRQDETATLEYNGVMAPGTIAIIGSLLVRPDAWHLVTLAERLRSSPSPESRRSYALALDDMRQGEYVLFRQEQWLAR